MNQSKLRARLMSAVNYNQQSFTHRDHVATPTNRARLDSPPDNLSPASALKADSAGAVHSGAKQQHYPVLLRLADVSTPKPAETLVQITLPTVESAQESISSGRALLGLVSNNVPTSAASTFASLLAASPTLQRTKSELPKTDHSPVTPSPSPALPKSSLATPYNTEASETAPVESPATRPPVHQRIDRPAIKPLRRPFKITRPAWMPEIPPTLVVGTLICFSALLIGMLWRGGDSDAPPNLAPAAQDRQNGNSAPSNVATVPSPVTAPAEVTAAKASGKRVSKGRSAKRKAMELARRPAEKLPAAVAEQTSSKQLVNSIPAPTITGVRPLPPVETMNVADPFYGQPVGGPTPHVVENPYGQGRNPVYEARRPHAQFQGNITPPESATFNERY